MRINQHAAALDPFIAFSTSVGESASRHVFTNCFASAETTYKVRAQFASLIFSVWPSVAQTEGEKTADASRPISLISLDGEK